MSEKLKNRVIKGVAVLSSAALLLSFAGCGAKQLSAVSIKADAKPIYPQSADLSSHYCNTENLKEIDTSGLITLLFDENSSAVGVSITGSTNSKLWSVLPQTASDDVTSDEAEILGLEVIHNGSKYYLNSQDNCVAFGGASWKTTDNGFVVTYLITDNSACIENIEAGATDETYKTAAGSDILYKAIVTYTLKDGCLYSSLKWKNLGNRSDVLVSIGFLEYFGASSLAQAGDFILVPDGSGAIIDTASAENVDPVRISVYGNDLGSEDDLTAVVPAYGIKNGSDALAAVIEKGDAIAHIEACKVKCESNYNHVGASFAITPSSLEGDNIFYSTTSYTGEISLCFRFLSGVNATYAGLAAACREQLIRNYTLSTRTVSVETDIPLLVTLLGAAGENGFFSTTKKLTTFSQAQDVLTRVKSKGINNVFLRCSGFLSGGLNADNAARAVVPRNLGGKDGLTDLNGYAAGQNFKLFVDVDLLTDSSSTRNGLKNILGKVASISVPNVLTQGGYIADAPERALLSPETLPSAVLTVLKQFNGLDSTGYCINDIGSYLYSDFENSADRQAVRDTVAEEITPLTTQSLVMVNGGNFYSLKNADVVCNLPMTCRRSGGEAYKAVPFVQIILHGIVDFAYDGLNLSSDNRVAFLRSIEYGALPGFVLSNNTYGDSENYAKQFSTDNWLSFMYECYGSSSKVLSDLRGSRITNHYAVSEGVYCTEYESTTKIYVNYTDTEFSVSGVTVAPLSFFRVN